MKTLKKIIACGFAASMAKLSFGAGILTPLDAPDSVLKITEHHVSVVINNGFARTEVRQTFLNEGQSEREAIYAVPVPEKGSLSEMEMQIGERVLSGEVLRKEEAERVYEEEKSQGNDAGLATKESYQRFEFRVSRIPAGGEARMMYVYYEPLVLDTGIGRYVYPLEEGGTDEAVESFWTRNEKVESNFSIQVDLKSSWPVEDVRSPGMQGRVERIDEKTMRYSVSSEGSASLNEDFVFYYKLSEGLPGRLEMLTYRESDDKPGTFMLLLTPGEDLERLSQGADYVFALDVSGSMAGKLSTLAGGVKRAIRQMQPEDRFRIVAFNRSSWNVTSNWLNATEANVDYGLQQIDALQSNGGTNVYAGVERALKGLDSDRVSSLILVTDGVTNQGIVDPRKFYELLHAKDIRFYGFLLGNSSNWPLMRVMCEATGGYYKSVSNADDILGEIVLAKNKIVRQAVHYAELKISGVQTFDVSDFQMGKIFHGQQLALFGRYDGEGVADVRLTARISGQEKVYETRIHFPKTDATHPELERIWAMDQIQKIQVAEMIGFADPSETKDAIADIGVAYQIVTDHTAMVALGDEGFARHGIERRNRDRVAAERAAQSSRTVSGAQRVDTQKPMYSKPAPSVGGGGAFGPWFALVAVGFGVLVVSRKRGTQLMLVAGIAGLSLMYLPSMEASQDRPSSTRENLNTSVQRFWEASDALAQEPQREKGAARIEETRSSSVSGQSPQSSKKVDQSVSTRSNSGHLGLRLFDWIPIFDFNWGDKHRSEDERFRGSVSR